MADRSLEGMALPLEVRARLAELELELSEGKAAPARGLRAGSTLRVGRRVSAAEAGRGGGLARGPGVLGDRKSVV